MQSVDGVVEDLHAWLRASGEKAPFVLVAHSIAGLYARRFVTRFASEAAGLVFVGSSHEEQAWRLHELDREGPGLDDLTARLGLLYKPGRASAMADDSAVGCARSRNADRKKGPRRKRLFK